MPQNSIAACPDGIEKAKQALKRKGLSRQKLAGYKDCNLSRSTIDNFFNGKAVSNESFVSVCKVLELDFDEVAGIAQASRQVSENSAPNSEPVCETINIKLPGQQRRNLQQALLDAFPSKSSLERMLSFELDKNLNAIVEGGSLQDIVFALITTAESQGWIQDFTTDYPVNKFVITCRIAAREYTFGQFTEVEVADFNDEQIESFSQKWFTAKEDTVKAIKFVEKLQDDKPIRELATSPLLLTLLCLVFEESAEFPKNRSELYKEGLDVLLKKWDVKRNIERDQIYKKLSLKRKEDLLSQVAYSTFEQGQYFFKQKEIEDRIIEYIRDLPDCSDDLEALQLDSEAVLKSIEAQHGLFVERARGIYSFSHLTFHEYFTAREIKETGDNKSLLDLCTHITETRWREVFLLTVGMLKSADSLLLLMKQQIDSLLEGDEKLQQFLTWVEEKSNSVKAPYKIVAVRAYYFVIGRDRYRDLTRELDRGTIFRQVFFLYRYLNGDLDRYLALEDELKHKLQQLKPELTNARENYNIFKQWCLKNGTNWIEQLRSIMIEHRCGWS